MNSYQYAPASSSPATINPAQFASPALTPNANANAARTGINPSVLLSQAQSQSQGQGRGTPSPEHAQMVYAQRQSGFNPQPSSPFYSGSAPMGPPQQIPQRPATAMSMSMPMGPGGMYSHPAHQTFNQHQHTMGVVNPMSMSSMTNIGVNSNNNNINPLSVNSPSTPMSPIGSIGAMANMGQYNSPNPNVQSQNQNPQVLPGSNLYPTNHGHAHGGHGHAQGLGLGTNMGMGGLGFGIQRPPTAAGVFNSRPSSNTNANANTNPASNMTPNPNSTPNPNIRPPSRPHTAGSSHSVHSVHSATGSNSGSGSGSGANSQQTQPQQQQQSPIVPQQQSSTSNPTSNPNPNSTPAMQAHAQRTGSPFLSRRESRESLSQQGMSGTSGMQAGMGMGRVGSPFVVPNQGAGQSLSDGQGQNQQPGDRASTPAQGQMNQQRTMNGANPYNPGGGMGPGPGLGNNPSQLNTGFGQQQQSQQSQIHPGQPSNPTHPSHPPTNPSHQNPAPPPTSNMPPLTPYQQQQMHSLQNLTPQQIQAFTPQQQMQIQQLQMQMQMHAGGGGGGQRLGQQQGMQQQMQMGQGQMQGQGQLGQMGQLGQGQMGQGQMGQQEYQQTQAQRFGGGVGGQQQEQMQQSQIQQREYQQQQHQQQQQQQQRQLDQQQSQNPNLNQNQNQQRQREERMIAFGAGTGAGAGGVGAGGNVGAGNVMQSVPSQNVIANPGAGQHGQHSQHIQQQQQQQQFNPGSGQTMGHAQIGIGQQLGQGIGQGQMGQGQMGQGQMNQMNQMGQMSQMNPSQMSQMNQMNPMNPMSQMTKPSTPSRPGTSGGGGVVHNGPIGAGSIGVGGSIASPGGAGGAGAGVMDLGRGMMSPQHTQHPSHSHPSHPSHMQQQQQQQPQHAQMGVSMSPVNLGPGNNMGNMSGMGGMGGMGGGGMGSMGTMGGMGTMGTMNSMTGMSGMSNMSNMVNLGGAGVGVGNRSASVHSPVSMSMSASHRPSSSSGHPGAHPGLGTGVGAGAGMNMNMNMNMHASSSSSAGAGTMGGHPAATHQSHSNQHTAHPSAPHTPHPGHPSQQASNQGAHPHAHSSQPPNQNQHPNSSNPNQNPNNPNANPNNPAIPDSTTRITSVPLAHSFKLIPALSASEIADIKIWMKRDKAYEGVYRGMMGRMRAELLGGGGGSGSGSGSPSGGGGGGSRPAGIRERRWWERDVEAQTQQQQQQQQQQRHGMHPHPHAQDLPIVNNIPRRKEPFKIIYPRASTLSRDAASSSSSRNRLVRRRDGVRLPLINSRSGVRRGGKAGGDLKDLLVPVRLEFDVEHYRFRDTFVWNLNDPVVTPEHFAQTLVEDYGLAQNFHSLITKSIQEQLSDYRAHSSMSFFADANDSPPPSATSTTANTKALTNGSAAQNSGAEGDIAPLRCGVLSKDDELWWDAWRKRLRNKRGAVRAFETVSGEAEEARRKKRKVGAAADVPAEEGKAKKSILGEPMLLDDVFMESNFGLLEENHREEMRILIKLDITVGSVKLDDQFEWDLDNGDTTPEEFAEVYGNDLGLVGEFKTAIAHSIREQVHTYRKSLFLVGHPTDGSAVQDEDLKSSLLSPVLSVARLPDQTGSYTPTLNYLSDGELDRIDKEREKELNKRRKRNTRGRRGLMLPDREPLKTHRTPAIGFPPMDSSLLAIAAAAAAPTSRRAAAAAATVNIAQMVASENGTSIIPTTPVPVVPQVLTPITSKLPKPRGSFKPPSYSSSVLKARAKVAAPTPSTAADASTFEPPLDGDLPLPSVAVAATPDLRAAKVISARRQRELEKEAKEKEFADGQHANMIDGVWHCSNCGCPESIAIGRRKGPLGDKSQCGACGKFWHRHRRPRPVEYHTEVEYHLNLKLEAERGKTPSKKRGAAGRVANTETREATPVRGSAAPPEPDNKAAFLKPDASPDNKVSRRSRGPSSEPPERPISRASSSTSSTSERPLAQAVLANGVSHKPSSSKSDIKVEEPAIENQPPPETQAPVPENMEPSEESTENKPDNIETSSQEPPPPPPVAANPPPTSTPPARPKWLEDAIAEILTRYPDDRMDVIMRRVSPDAPPDWRIRCLDCPGKLYIHGPGETLNGYEVHLRNRQHRSRVNARVNGTAQNTT